MSAHRHIAANEGGADAPERSATNERVARRDRVEFFTTTWERDYRAVLAPGFMRRKIAQFGTPFRRVTVVVNNVRDRKAAAAAAHAAVSCGEIDRAVFVRDALPQALRLCGLRQRDLGRLEHYIDHFLVTVASAEADYLLHCGAEIDLTATFDWVNPAVSRLDGDPSLFVANPSWTAGDIFPKDEALQYEAPYFVSLAFSDQIFLAKREMLAGPVYELADPTNRWFPLSDQGSTFEKRVYSMMASKGLLRITDERVGYVHQGPQGTHYPRPRLWDSMRGRVRRAVRRVIG